MLWLPLQYYILGQKKRKKYLKLIQFKRLQIVEKEMTQLSHLTLLILTSDFGISMNMVVVAGEQWRSRRRRRGSSRRPWRGSSCCRLCSATSSLSDHAPASGLVVPRCLLPARRQRCLPASVCLPTLPHTLHLLAQGRQQHSQSLLGHVSVHVHVTAEPVSVLNNFL